MGTGSPGTGPRRWLRGLVYAGVVALGCGGTRAGGSEDPQPETGTDGAGSTTRDDTGWASTTGPGTDETTGAEDPGSTTTGAAEPTPTGEHDLDGDGVDDSILWIAPCPRTESATCLHVVSSGTDTTAVELWPGPAVCNGKLHGRTLTVVGDHEGSALFEVMAAGCIDDGTTTRPIVTIVDVDGGTVVAETIAPPSQVHAWVEAVASPQGRLHPFLAPSYGDGAVLGDGWKRVCAYRPDRPGDPVCGPGFSAIGLATPPPVFREVGGTLQDLDADGWEDINLIFHRTIHTVSVSLLTSIAIETFDVAAADEPHSLPWFHAGRNYGTHVAFTGSDGLERLLVVGGAPVGAFDDELCNMSRFVAVLESTPGDAASRALAWSRYYGFSSTIFATNDPQYAEDPAADVARLADVVDGCIHRFSDSRSRMNGEDVVVFNVFSMDAPIDRCLDEQFALYQDPPWTQEKAQAWYACFGQNRQAPGVWGMQVLRERDGAVLTGSPETYVWGRVDTLLPGGEVLYLVEHLPGAGAFDLSDRQASPLQVRALVDGQWSDRGTFPVPGRPRIVPTGPGGPRGLGSYSHFAELDVRDRDGDGLGEVRLANGTWIGWNETTRTFELE